MNRRSFFAAFGALGAGLAGLASAPVRLTLTQRLKQAADYCHGRTSSLPGTYTYKVRFISAAGEEINPGSPFSAASSPVTITGPVTPPPPQVVRRRLYQSCGNHFHLIQDEKV